MIEFVRETTRKKGEERGRKATKPIQYQEIQPLNKPLRLMLNKEREKQRNRKNSWAKKRHLKIKPIPLKSGECPYPKWMKPVEEKKTLMQRIKTIFKK